MIVLQITIAWFFADFITGVFHWFEDRYLSEEQSLEFFSGVAEHNAIHHRKPTDMIRYSKWSNCRSSMVFAAPVSCVVFWMGAPVWLWLGLLFTGLGNLIHRFAHVPKRQLPRWILFMQKTGVFISHEHHNTHHRFDAGDGRLVDPRWKSSIAFCPMTNWVNPILDFLHFWDHVELLLSWVGIHPMADSVLETDPTTTHR